MPETNLQSGPAPEANDLTGLLVRGRVMVPGIIDIEAGVEYVLVFRRLLGSRGKVVVSTFWVGPLRGLPSALVNRGVHILHAHGNLTLFVAQIGL